MQKQIFITSENGKISYPSIETIQIALVENDGNLVIVFENCEFDPTYEKLLRSALSKSYVFNVYWQASFLIKPAIETTKIVEKIEDIYQCAIAYRAESVSLMRLLGETYQINPFESKELFDLKIKSRANAQRVEITANWTFYFHGAECCFVNKITRQTVEVIIKNNGEFGELTGFFFHRYIETTQRLQQLALFFEKSYISVAKALDMGYLVHIHNDPKQGRMVKIH